MFTRNFILILLSNIILSASMPMLIILGGLAGAYLSPTPIAATLPPSVQMLAGVFVAAPISLIMGRKGRKFGFLCAALLIVFGGAVGAVALMWQSFILLCLAHFLLGGALVCINFFRFAAAEAVEDKWKSKAISYTLASGLIAAIIGPELFSYTKDTLAPIAFAGAYCAVAVLGLVGFLPLLALKDLAPVGAKKSLKGNEWGGKFALFRRPNVVFAIAGAALSTGIMVLLMTPTTLAMVGCGFSGDQAADVIRWHVIAMFAPGLVTGGLIQKFGTTRITITGLIILVASSCAALMGVELANFYAALILLGVGWNFGFIGSTHLLQTSLSAEEKPLVQGANDTIIAIAGSAASLLSGALYFGIGWGAIAAIVAPIIGGALLLYFIATRQLSTA